MDRRSFMKGMLIAGAAPMVMSSGIARGVLMPLRTDIWTLDDMFSMIDGDIRIKIIGPRQHATVAELYKWVVKQTRDDDPRIAMHKRAYLDPKLDRNTAAGVNNGRLLLFREGINIDDTVAMHLDGGTVIQENGIYSTFQCVRDGSLT